jgi:hypothetical protein
MTIRMVGALVALGLMVSSGCRSTVGESPPPPPPEAAPGCNPIIGDDCLTPFPSTFHEQVDPSSPTGYRVQLGSGALPQERSGIPLKPDRLNSKDGFSPATPFVVYFAKGVDASPFWGWKDPTPSLAPTAAVQVIEYDTGARVLAFAELDANVSGETDRQALLIHPLVRLKPATRYVIALVGLNDAQGAPLAPAPFRALRDGTPLSASLTPLKPRYDEIFAALGRAGVARGSLALAWDVVTASDATATGHLLGMRDHALALADAGQLGYTITSSTDGTDPHLLRQVLATVQVPSYLADDTGKSMMVFDAAGNPSPRAIVDVPIVINVPRCAATATAPLPVVVFGHGLFGNALSTMSGAPAMAAADSLCTLFVGTDWIGLASDDINRLPDLLAADLNNFYVISDRLQQAQLNALVMTRLFLTKIKDDPALQISGHAVTDGSHAYYFGVSNGGIQGGTFMALTPDVVRGVLNVPGGEWTLLLYRSTDLSKFGQLLDLVLPDALDRQIAVAITQSDWDYTDPLTFAPHILADPLPGVPAKHILIQESIDDAQVTNVATRVLARTMGITGLDLTEPVPGLATASAPLDSAYTQWDSHPSTVPPLSNSHLDADNGAHDAVWKDATALGQISAFCQPSGQVASVCAGPCNIP